MKNINKIAKIIIADTDYIYDPKHEHKPHGGNWIKTEKGWSDKDKEKEKEKEKNDNKSENKSISDTSGNDYNNITIDAVKKNMRNNLESVADKSVKILVNKSTDPVNKENMSSFVDTSRKNAESVINRYKKVLRPHTEQLLRNHVDSMLNTINEAVNDGSLQGVRQTDVDKLMRADIMKSLHQQVETERRSVGDHGIRHNLSNAKNSVDMLTEVQNGGVKVTGKDKLMALTIMANHDLGYTVGEAATSGAKGKQHKANSGELARNERSLYESVFGSDTDKVIDLIEHHDDAEYDWENKALASSIHLADTTALFGKEKVQDLFIRSDKAMSLACQLRLGAESNDDDLQKDAKEKLHQLVDKEFDGNKQLHNQINEMTEGKFSTTVDILSRFSGRLNDFKFDKDSKVMNVNMSYSPEGETLDMLFGDEVAAKQFNKFIEGDLQTEAIQGKYGSTIHKDVSGKPQIQVNINGIDKNSIDAATNSSMKDFLHNTVRGPLRDARKLLTKPPEDVFKDVTHAKAVFEPYKKNFTQEEWDRLMDYFNEYDKTQKTDDDSKNLKQQLASFPMLESEKSWVRNKTKIASMLRIAAKLCFSSDRCYVVDDVENLMSRFKNQAKVESGKEFVSLEYSNPLMTRMVENLLKKTDCHNKVRTNIVKKDDRIYFYIFLR